jgi:tetratricopeptide (TPR) repeat protein
MRFGRESRERMAWLVEFLKGWYSSREMLEETEKLAARFAELLKAGEKALAAETLDYRQCLADAMDARFQGSATDRLVNDCLDAGEVDRVRGIVRSVGMFQLRPATILRLTNGRLVTASQVEAERNRRRQWMARLGENPGFDAIVDVLDPKSLPLHENPDLWFCRAAALHGLGRDEEALEDLEMCRSVPERPKEALLKAEVLWNLSRFRELIDVLTQHADEFASDPRAQLFLAISSAILGDFDRAIAVSEAASAGQEDPDWRQLLEAFLGLRHQRCDPIVQFGLAVIFEAFAEARTVWNEKLRGRVSAAEIAVLVKGLIDEKNLHFFRTLICESDLDNEQLPLVVAMDYFGTGDRAPLEKLSAEVRPIAEEIVAELQKKLSPPVEAVPKTAARKKHGTPSLTVPK